MGKDNTAKTTGRVTLSLWEPRQLVFVEGSLPNDTIETLKETLRYEDPDAEHTEAWKQGNWSGYHYLFRQSDANDNWFFPVGLLSKVTRILELHGVAYETEGVRRPGRGEQGYDWHAPFELRDYQHDAVDAALEGGGGLVVIPTGGGKTVVGLRLAYELQHPFIVLAHTVEIAEQWCERIAERLGVTPARYFGGDRENGPVMVALYQSVYDDGEIREDARLDHDVAIYDEAHRVGSTVFNEVALACRARWRFGFSATPTRGDNAMLKVLGGVGERVYEIGVEELISKGYLAEPEWRILDPPKVDGRYRNWQSEYKHAIVQNDARNDMLVTEIERVPKPALVTTEQVAHGERLEALLQERSVDARFVSGSSSDREEIIESFRAGELSVMVATAGLVSEGFDVPSIESFVLAGGKKSKTSIIQQVGRALRPGESGEAVIVDVADKGTGGYNSWVGEHWTERYRNYIEYYGEYGP